MIKEESYHPTLIFTELEIVRESFLDDLAARVDAFSKKFEEGNQIDEEMETLEK